jgi:hypothetical protein
MHCVVLGMQVAFKAAQGGTSRVVGRLAGGAVSVRRHRGDR